MAEEETVVKAFRLYIDSFLDLPILGELLDGTLERVCNGLCLRLWQREVILQLPKHLACVEGRVTTPEARDEATSNCLIQPVMGDRSDIVHR